jgi:hypothetical protein
MTGGEIGPTKLTPLQGLPVLRHLELTLYMLTAFTLRSLEPLVGTAVKELVVTLDCSQARGGDHKHIPVAEAKVDDEVNALRVSGVSVAVRHKQRL